MAALLQTLRNLGPARLGLIAAVGAIMLGAFAYVATQLATPSYGLLYADLSLKDSGQIAAKLDAMNIPYQVSSDGTLIRVPEDQVGRLRITMAENGIPSGGSVGYEIFDKTDALGATNFQQGINEMRALEGELERTIDSLSVVDTSRVHLVLPKRELFSRDQQTPSASIVIKTRGAAGLDKQQIAGILNLVAGAVPGLKTSEISIIDQNGNLLARGDEGGSGAVFGSGNDEQRLAYETQLSRSVEEMLERSLGYGHVRVDVNADMDFDKLTTSQEVYDPDGQVVRSTQTSSDTTESNQPADQPVTVQTNLPAGQQTQNQTQNNQTRSKEAKTEETTNYEISKKVTTQTREAGVVKRLSVAVLVDGTYPEVDGKPTYKPRTPEEIAALTKLVQSAVGYDAKRGDRVEVVNMRFAVPPELAGEPGPIFLGLTKSDLFRIGETLALAIVAILAILLVVRPAVNRVLTGNIAATGQGMLGAPGAQAALPSPAGGMLPAGMAADGTAMAAVGADGAVVPVIEEPETMIDITQVEGRVRVSSMRKIGEIVDKHPEEAVAIIRSWMYQTP